MCSVPLEESRRFLEVVSKFDTLSVVAGVADIRLYLVRFLLVP